MFNLKLIAKRFVLSQQKLKLHDCSEIIYFFKYAIYVYLFIFYIYSPSANITKLFTVSIIVSKLHELMVSKNSTLGYISSKHNMQLM